MRQDRGHRGRTDATLIVMNGSSVTSLVRYGSADLCSEWYDRTNHRPHSVRGIVAVGLGHGQEHQTTDPNPPGSGHAIV
jgi:hypothetical protein